MSNRNAARFFSAVVFKQPPTVTANAIQLDYSMASDQIKASCAALPAGKAIKRKPLALGPKKRGHGPVSARLTL